MANTKNMTREKRREAKRTQRRALKAVYAGLSKRQRKQLREDRVGLRAFVASQAAPES